MTTMKDLVKRFGLYGEGDWREPYYTGDDPRGGPIDAHLWSKEKLIAFDEQDFNFPEDAATYLDWEAEYDSA